MSELTIDIFIIPRESEERLAISSTSCIGCVHVASHSYYDALPDGEMGIPRPSDHCFGIVINTEIALEHMIEMEMEMKVIMFRKDGEFRSPNIYWRDTGYSSPELLWNLFDGEINEQLLNARSRLFRGEFN